MIDIICEIIITVELMIALIAWIIKDMKGDSK